LTPAPRSPGSAAPDGPSPSDAALVRRTLRGEPSAFGELYDRHVERVFRYVALRVQGPAAADLTHDCFERALRGLAELREPERFGSWLMQIAHRQVLNHWARRQRHPDAEPLDESDAALLQPGAPSEAERELQLAEVTARLAELGTRQRDVVALRFGAGLSLRETAAVMGVSEAAVKQLQRRAIERLRQTLGAE
jgi:RNA polymerase sigma-70 factor (ECF subfamily)